jgi:hypothetical protein
LGGRLATVASGSAEALGGLGGGGPLLALVLGQLRLLSRELGNQLPAHDVHVFVGIEAVPLEPVDVRPVHPPFCLKITIKIVSLYFPLFFSFAFLGRPEDGGGRDGGRGEA